jgi:hypothetical protein
VIFKDLKNESKHLSGSRNLEQTRLFQRLTARASFWICYTEEYKEQEEEHIKIKGDCCFSHIISLPDKKRVELSLFVDYQKTVCTSLKDINTSLDKRGY